MILMMITCLLRKINLFTIGIWQTCRSLQISRYKHKELIDKFKFKLQKELLGFLKYEIKFFATHQ